MENFHQLRIKFLPKREEAFVLLSFTILLHIVFFNFNAIECSNLATTAVELTFGGLMAFVLGKYFFKKEEKSKLEAENEVLEAIIDKFTSSKNGFLRVREVLKDSNFTKNSNDSTAFVKFFVNPAKKLFEEGIAIAENKRPKDLTKKEIKHYVNMLNGDMELMPKVVFKELSYLFGKPLHYHLDHLIDYYRHIKEENDKSLSNLK